MLRFAGVLFALLVFLSACATANGPSLSHTNVRRIADAEIRNDMKLDPRQYEVSEPHYIPRGDYWLVAYRLRTSKRVAFTIRVSDKIHKASINRDDGGIFEGALTEKPDYH